MSASQPLILTLLGLGAASLAMVGGAPSALAQSSTSPTAASSSAFAQFAPRPAAGSPRLDYELWDEALVFFVLKMGKSTRENASRPEPGLGTRRVWGHDSRYRLEGNRIVFSFLEPEVIQSLTDYRADLERIAGEVDIATLSRNEQLAFWMNLHNVAVIEQIARNYPVAQPARMKIGADQVPLDDAGIVTIRGVTMSPKDIRTQIVYPNWNDPRVIYGFFRGDIGSPSIQDIAFTGGNIGSLLQDVGNEFVNSLRGAHKQGSKLMVSEIYAEAQPFLFPDWPNDLRAHLADYADAPVKEILAETDEVSATVYENDLADLMNGERDPQYGFVTQSDDRFGSVAQRFRIPGSVQRLLQERAQKINKLRERKQLQGRVILLNPNGDWAGAEEVE